MAKDYIEERDGGYYLIDTRVSLDSVVYAYLRGESVEGIAESFPALNLEQIFGALAFYTANRDTVDTYLAKSKADYSELQQQWRRDHPSLYAKLTEARQRTPASGS